MTMIERIKNWLIKKLGGYTYAEMRGYVDYYASRNIRFSDEAIRNKRDAKEWYQRAMRAEAMVEAYKKLDDRLRRMVPMRAEIRESMERLHFARIPVEELELSIKRRLAEQMAGGILAHVGTVRTEDRPRHEYVWACEFYLLRKEDDHD